MEEAEGLSWQGCIASCLVSISVFDTPQTSGEYILNQKRTKGSEKVNHKLDQGTHINGWWYLSLTSLLHFYFQKYFSPQWPKMMSPSVILMLFYIWEDARIWIFFWKYLTIWRPVLLIISPLSTEYLTPDLHQELLSGDAEGPQLQWRGRLCCSLTRAGLTLQLHGLQHNRLPCSSPSPGAYSDSCPLSWRYHATISSSVIPFSSCLNRSMSSQSWRPHVWGQVFPVLQSLQRLQPRVFPASSSFWAPGIPGAHTVSMCPKWFVKFYAGDFSLDDVPYVRRPVEVEHDQIETLTENNQLCTMQEIDDILKYPAQGLKIVCITWLD